MSKTSKITDGLVIGEDFIHFQDATNRGEFKQLVFDLCQREPEIVFGIAEQFDLVLSLLNGASMSIKQRAILERKITLMLWIPLLVLERAHRRAWEDFLPSVEPGRAEGGAV